MVLPSHHPCGVTHPATAEANALERNEGRRRPWDVVAEISNDSAAMLILLEHRWAIPLRDAVMRAGGVRLAVRPDRGAATSGTAAGAQV